MEPMELYNIVIPIGALVIALVMLLIVHVTDRKYRNHDDK